MHLETLLTYVPSLVAQRIASEPTAIFEPWTDRFSAANLFANISRFKPLAKQIAER